MMKIKLPFFLLLILVTMSCNQDQSVLDGIKGTWKIQSRTLDGVAVPEKDLSGLQYNFEPCKVGEGNCDGTITLTDKSKGPVSLDMKYDVTDGGSKFFMKFSFLGLVAKSFNADILELSESKFVFQYEDTSSASGIFGRGRKSRRDKSQKGVITVETLVR